MALGLGALAIAISGSTALPAPLLALAAGVLVRPMAGGVDLAPGARVAAGPLLRVGVVLLGLRMDAEVASAVGWPTVALLGGLIAATLAFGLGLGRALRLSARFSAVLAASTAICGAAAALAVSAVTPASPERERQAAVAVAAATVFSTVAMILLPGLAVLFGFDARQAGFFLGASIADVAQVVGAGYALSPEAGDVAVATKLTRVLFLVPVVLMAALAFRGRDSLGRVRAPLFVLAFFGVAIVSILGLAPAALRPPGQALSDLALTAAVAGLGLTLPARAVFELGVGPLVLSSCGMAFITAVAAAVSFL
ncbi:putative sulfate exporter family transporter [Phenylobacterium sp.]|uniref:YeiH family protein n=1 Tax=Phenylobacterium sp. TaxID=1871053 RepID=UPI00301D757F